jgi:hypothetical protein
MERQNTRIAIAQQATNAAPQRLMNTQQKRAIAKLANQGTPIQVMG